MNTASFIATTIVSASILIGGGVKLTKPWLPNTLGYEELGWVHRGHMSVLGDVSSIRKWTGLTGFQSRLPWPIDHYKIKLEKGQKIEMVLTGEIKHGRVIVGVAKRAGYYLNPLKVGQITQGEYIRLRPGDTSKSLIYEIKEDGYYHISISTIGKLNKNYTVKSDMRYDVKWRLL